VNAPWYRVAASFSNGATIPYILKALRIHGGVSDIVAPADCRIELRGLLTMICDDPPPPQYVGLEICPSLDAVVVCVEQARVRHYDFIPSSSPSGRRLYHSIGFKGHDLESLSSTLWNQHEDAILGCKFSREPVAGADHNEHEWVPFSPTEWRQVRQILGLILE
jgi:hypothetical protein